MSGESFAFPLFDAASGTLMVPWWGLAAAVALVVVLVVLAAMLRGGPAIIVGGVASLACFALAGAIAWVATERATQRERVDERRALLTRAQDLARQAAMPASPLGCLDAAAGEVVEAACERAVFATPEAVAAGTAYTAARLALLSDGIDYAFRANASADSAMPGLRRALEFDRFGFVARVLVTHYGCSAERCDAFTLFRDTTKLSANLSERAFDTYVERHAASWRAPPARPGPALVTNPGGASPVPAGMELPSSSSIPPVSIMVPESTATQPNSGAAPVEAAAAPQPARRTARPARPAPQPAPGAPVQLVPPAPSALGNTGAAPRAQ